MTTQTIFFDAETEDFLLDGRPIRNLSPLEQNILRFLWEHPFVKHTKDTLIENGWDDPYLAGIADESLYTTIASLRRKIERQGKKPAHIVNWRGQGKSGYRFFPAIDLESGEP